MEKHGQALSVTSHQHSNHQGCRHRNAHDVSQGRPDPGGEPVLLNRFPKRPLHEHSNTCKNPKTIHRRGVRQAFLISSERNPERQTRKAVHRMTRACMSKAAKSTRALSESLTKTTHDDTVERRQLYSFPLQQIFLARRTRSCAGELIEKSATSCKGPRDCIEPMYGLGLSSERDAHSKCLKPTTIRENQ